MMKIYSPLFEDEEKKPERELKENHVEDGYCSEPMDEYPAERQTVILRKMRRRFSNDD